MFTRPLGTTGSNPNTKHADQPTSTSTPTVEVMMKTVTVVFIFGRQALDATLGKDEKSPMRSLGAKPKTHCVD